MKNTYEKYVQIENDVIESDLNALEEVLNDYSIESVPKRIVGTLNIHVKQIMKHPNAMVNYIKELIYGGNK